MSQCLCDYCHLIDNRYDPTKWSMSVYANGAQVVYQWPTTARWIRLQNGGFLPRGKVGNQFWAIGSGGGFSNPFGWVPPVQQGNINVWFWDPAIDGDDPIGEWHQPLTSNYWLGYINTTPDVGAWVFTHDDYCIGPLRNTYASSAGLGVYTENFVVAGTTGVVNMISNFGNSNVVTPPLGYQQWCGAFFNWEDGVFNSSTGTITSAVARKRTTFGALDVEIPFTFNPAFNPRPGGTLVWTPSIAAYTGTVMSASLGFNLGVTIGGVFHIPTGKWNTFPYGGPQGAFNDRVYWNGNIGGTPQWGATTYPWTGANIWIRSDSLSSAWYGSVPGFSNAGAFFRGCSYAQGQWAVPTAVGAGPHLRLLRFNFGSAGGSAPAATIDCPPFVSSGLTGLAVSWVDTPPGYYLVTARVTDTTYAGKTMVEFQHIDIDGNLLHHGIWHGTPGTPNNLTITHFRPDGKHIYNSEIVNWDRSALPVHQLFV